jgi:hypothetical protein
MSLGRQLGASMLCDGGLLTPSIRHPQSTKLPSSVHVIE